MQLTVKYLLKLLQLHFLLITTTCTTMAVHFDTHPKYLNGTNKTLDTSKWSKDFQNLYYHMNPKLIYPKNHWSGELHRIRDLRMNVNKPNPIQSWKEMYDSVTLAGHEFCAIIRDNWACSGKIYTERLRQTPLYQLDKYSLNNMKPHMKILMEGNSHLGQLVFPIICFNDSITFSLRRENSHLAYFPESDTTLMLLCNDRKPMDQMLNELINMNWNPDIIVLSNLNGFSEERHVRRYNRTRHQMYTDAFPNAELLNYFDSYYKFQKNCPAEFSGCDKKEIAAHECVPGPILQQSERLVNELFSPHFVGLNRSRIKRMDL